MGVPVRRRRLRKGTHSCQECRRRKIKCIWPSGDARCRDCEDRDNECVTQEHVAKTEARDGGAPDAATITLRLGQLEKLMSSLVSSQSPEGPGESSFPSQRRDANRPNPGRSTSRGTSIPESHLDLLDSTVVSNAHGITAAASGPSGSEYPLGFALTPAPTVSSSTAGADYETPGTCGIPGRDSQSDISQRLYDLLPPPNLRKVLAYESPGVEFALNRFHNEAGRIAGKPEPPSSLALPEYPPRDSHPTLIAKRLLQYSMCMMHLPPNYDMAHLQLPNSEVPCVWLSRWMGTVSGLVTSDDRLIGCVEGLECLYLQGMMYWKMGHLRKAWMASRRALSMAQLMGLGRMGRLAQSAPLLRSCCSGVEARHRADPNVLWYKFNAMDRHLSLKLGLPIGSRCNKFADAALQTGDSDMEKLDKAITALTVKIADRNDMSVPSIEAYTLTQTVDIELNGAKRLMDDSWWLIPDVASALHADRTTLALTADNLCLQIRYYTLVVLLHLPYLLRERHEPRYEYNYDACMRASSDLLERFLVFRAAFYIYITGRNIDYPAFIAAMTLLLGHLGPSRMACQERHRHRELAEATHARFLALGSQKQDRLSLESAETIQQLLPIIYNNGDRQVQLHVPFLGTITIPPRADKRVSDRSARPSIPSEAELYPPMAGHLDGHPGDASDVGQSGFFPFYEMPLISIDADRGLDGPWDESGWMDFSAESDQLVLQGVDTTYWSTINMGL